MKSITLKALGVMLSAFFIFTSQAQTVKQPKSCYDESHISASSRVALRNAPKVATKTNGLAKPHSPYEVYATWDKDGKCWVNVEGGWLRADPSNTYYEPFIPTPIPPTPTPEPKPDLPNPCPPVLSDDKHLIEKVGRACQQIAKYPKWIEYLKQSGARSIGDMPVHLRTVSEGIVRVGTVDRDTMQIQIMPGSYRLTSTTQVAGVIIHEACHVLQYVEKRLMRDQNKREVECYRTQLNYVRDAHPGWTSHIDSIRQRIREYSR